MTDSMNIDSDIVESLDDLESLERIQMEYFRKPGHDHGKVILPDMISEISASDEIVIKSEEVIEKMDEGNIHEEIHESIGTDLMEETINSEVDDMMHNVMEVDVNEESVTESHHDHNLFSEGVMDEEIIEDEQVIQESNEPRMYEDIENISVEQVLEEENKDSYQSPLDEITSETVVEETVIESTPSAILQDFQEEEQPEEDETITDSKPISIQTHEIQRQCTNEQKLQIQQTFVPQVTSVKKSDGQGKVVTSNVYVMNTTTGAITAQSLLQGNTILAPKDAKMRVVLPSGMDTTSAIRIVAPQGKVLGSTAKTITIAQAKQMGIFTHAKINQLLPATSKGGKLMVPSKKTVTVVKSPTKILPAPTALVTTAVVPSSTGNVAAAGAHKTQKVLIRSNSLKPGTILTTTSAPGSGASTAGQVIRIPTSQALAATTLQIPSAKPVQYVKLVGSGTKSQTFVPVKTVPVALTTSLLNNSQTAFKVVPISTAQATQGANTTQRVYIPTSAISQQQTSGVGQQSQSIAVMVPSHLIHQVKKEKVIPTVSTLRTTNGKRASTPSIKKEPTSPTATSPSNVPSTSPSNANISGTVQSSSSLVTVSNIMKHDVLKPPDVWSGDEAVLEANGIRPRKPCNCTKSMCLKLYCDCFANGEFCNQCNCTCCYNNLEHEEERQRAIKSCLERNPTAFRPKIGKTFTGSEERRHNKGCNCRRSGCLKNYCECYEAKIPCSKNCKCIGCKNTEGATNKRGLGGGYDPADDRLKADSTLKAIEYSVNTHRQAFSQITDELVEATCQCLVAKADKWDRQNKLIGTSSDSDEDIAQAMIIEEFGCCLLQIIEVVTKSIAKHHPTVSTSSTT